MRAAPQSFPTMLSISTQFAAYAPAAQPLVQARASVVMESKASLEALAKELNPSIGYWDPIGLANLGGNDGSPASGEAVGADSIGQERFIGYLRHSEIKHGRIAMAGFVGYCVHANNIRMSGMAPDVQSIPTGLSAPEVWDAMPDIAKWQIIVFVGVLDTWRENRVVLANEGQAHYMKGGKPGYFPTFDLLPHPVPFNLYDPWGVMKDKTEEQKAKGRLVEINNGRLAMLGLMSLVSEGSVPGSVPFLKGMIPYYSGEVMAPLSENAFAIHSSALF